MYTTKSVTALYRVFVGLRDEDIGVSLLDIETFHETSSGVDLKMKSGNTIHLKEDFEMFWAALKQDFAKHS